MWVTSLGITGCASPALPPAAGKPAPEFSLQTVTGDTLTLSSQRGKVVLVNFWAPWCGPCRVEQPTLNEIYTQNKDRGLEVWGIAVDSNRLAVELYVENMGVPYPVMMITAGSDTAVINRYEVAGIPRKVLIARTGEIHWEHEGAMTATDSLLQEIETLISYSTI